MATTRLSSLSAGNGDRLSRAELLRIYKSVLEEYPGSVKLGTAEILFKEPLN